MGVRPIQDQGAFRRMPCGSGIALGERDFRLFCENLGVLIPEARRLAESQALLQGSQGIGQSACRPGSMSDT